MNNRQANGRRRGRGGQQQRSGGGQGGQRDSGNRIDSRARGNAAQLLEKYKNLARDAQMQGDRVNTEYYLQFADHYFRVLAETRSRFEENNPGQQQRRPQNDDDFGDEFGFEAEGDRDDQPRGDESGNREDRAPREGREDRAPREGRGNREDRGERGNREARGDRDDRGNREDRGPRQERGPREDRGERRNGRTNGNGQYNGEEAASAEPVVAADAPEAATEEAPRPARRGLRTRRDRDASAEVEAPQGIDAAVLPPALGIDLGTSDEAPAEEKPKPRRGRPRRDAEVAAE